MDTFVQNIKLLDHVWLITESWDGDDLSDPFLSFCDSFLIWPLPLNVFSAGPSFVDGVLSQ